MRAWRERRRARRRADVLRDEPRARSGIGASAAARRLRRRAVGCAGRGQRDRARRQRRAAEDRMNAPARIQSRLDVRGQFPAIADWHYLDSAATAQKPQAVIDAITEAYARDY